MSSIAYVIPVIATIIHLAIQVFGTLRLRAAAEKINGVIRSRSDLESVRKAIQTNLFLGIPMLCNTVILTASLVWLFSVPGAMVWINIAVLVTGQLVIWRICRPVEKRFKAIPVESQDTDMLTEYQHYVEQWAGFNLFLKPPKRADSELL